MRPDESDCGAGWQNLRPIAESALLFPDTVTVTSALRVCCYLKIRNADPMKTSSRSLIVTRPRSGGEESDPIRHRKHHFTSQGAALVRFR